MPTVVQEARHPKLDGLLDLWERRCSGRRLPARRDFSIEDLRPWLGHLALIEVEATPLRLKIRLAGTIITAYEGKDDTGRYLDDVIPAGDLARRMEPYLECLRVRRPVFDTPLYRQDYNSGRSFQRLLLPCAADGETVDVIVLAVYTEQGRD